MLSPTPMTFKTNLPAGACPALSGFGVLGVSGRDAGAFLQAQVMSDVAALVPGQWHWSGWLTPKGRVIALFALLRLADDRYLLVTPDMAAAELAPPLQRFVFRSKLVIDASPGRVAAAGPAQAADAPHRIAGEPPAPLALDLGSPERPRTLWLLAPDDPALAAPDAGVDDAWRATDLAFGLPRLSPAQREAWTPQMLSLGRLSAFSLRKGCYPGQEIVARTHYLGQAKRELVRIRGEGLVEGQPVLTGDATVGTLVCTRADGREGLAVIAADAADPLQAGGLPCNREPLLEGLSRTP